MQHLPTNKGWRWLAAVGVSTLLIGACGGGDGGDDASNANECAWISAARPEKCSGLRDARATV